MSTPTPAHTALPWKASQKGDYSDFDGQSVVILADDRRVAVVHATTPTTEANAELIVRAVNAHQALVDALRGLLALQTRYTNVGLAEFDAARAALSLTLSPQSVKPRGASV